MELTNNGDSTATENPQKKEDVIKIIDELSVKDKADIYQYLKKEVEGGVERSPTKSKIMVGDSLHYGRLRSVPRTIGVLNVPLELSPSNTLEKFGSPIIRQYQYRAPML